MGLPLAAHSQAAAAQLLGAGKFTLPRGAGSGCQSLGQYMIMGLGDGAAAGAAAQDSDSQLPSGAFSRSVYGQGE